MGQMRTLERQEGSARLARDRGHQGTCRPRPWVGSRLSPAAFRAQAELPLVWEVPGEELMRE